MNKEKKSNPVGRRRLFYSLQTRLQAMTFIIVLLPMLLASWSSLYLLKKHLVTDMHSQLRTSISAATLSYHHEMSRVERAIMAISLNNTVKTTLRLEIFGQLKRELDQLVGQYDLDFLLITDGLGDIKVSPFPGFELTRDLYSHPVLYAAMLQGLYSGTMLEENTTILHFLELAGKNIDFAPIVTIEAASPIIVRDRVIGYILGGVMATGNRQLMSALQKAAGCKVSLVAGNRVAAVSGGDAGQPDRGYRFSGALDYQKSQSSVEHLHRLTSVSDAGETVFEYRPLEMPGEDSMIALVCSYSLNRFSRLLANIRGSMIGVFIVGMLLAVLLTSLMSRSIAAPLHRLTRAMDRMQKHGIYEPLPTARDDEIGELVTGFNQMATTIEERISDLNQEVEQRKKAEHRLAAESERLHVTLQSIADAVMAVDIEGRVVLLNRVATELIGLDEEDARGGRLEEFFSVKSFRTGKAVENLLAPILEQSKPRLAEGDLLLTTRDGREIQVTESCAPLTDNSGRVIGAVIAFRDVSDQRLMEEELAKTKKLESVGVLAGGIAHDFNNLLTAILGNLSLARLEAAGRDELLQHLVDAERASLRARDLTLQLLTFSRGGAPVKRSVDLSVLIRESAIFVARGTRVQLNFSLAHDLRRAIVDKGQIGQVIDNLVINGIQAMPEGGTITVKAVNVEIKTETPLPLVPGTYIRITVEDCGCGIEGEALERIFDPYFSTKESGNGLGLAICYAVVSKHGGYIGVRSTVGRGTIFDVYLPAVREDRAPNESSAVVEPGKKRSAGRILVMDNEQMVLRVLKSMLQTLGYSARCVEDGLEAVRVYQQSMGTDSAFDAVIFDLTVPGGMGGEEAVQRLRAIDPSLTAIVSSGYSGHAVMADYGRYGFDGVVAKPYRLSELSQVLQSTLVRRATASAGKESGG